MAAINKMTGRPNGWHIYKGFQPPERGWRYSPETMAKLDAEGKLLFPALKNGRIMLKRYLDEQSGVMVGDIWPDISQLRATMAERLGYPTQKPEKLLDRIIEASSNPGGVVLDPFCGCGTAVASAQRLGRKWIGIDITQLAISLIKTRLRDAYGDKIKETYDVIGEPVSLPDAEALAAQDPYQFQFWALGLVGARPAEQKKGADRGVDGRLYFHDEAAGGETKSIIFSVKAGHADVSHLRDLRGVLDREKAEIGVFVSLQEPTKPMRTEAASAGFYASKHWGKYPRLQILTISELLSGKAVSYPSALQRVDKTFKRAPRAEQPSKIAALGLGLPKDEGD